MDSSGFVPLSFLTNMKRISRLTEDMEIVLSSCKLSGILELRSGDGDKTRAMLVRKKQEWAKWVLPKKVPIEVGKAEPPNPIEVKKEESQKQGAAKKETAEEISKRRLAERNAKAAKAKYQEHIDWSVDFDRRWKANREKLLTESQEELLPNLLVKAGAKMHSQTKVPDDEFFAGASGLVAESEPEQGDVGKKATGRSFVASPKPSIAIENKVIRIPIEEEKKIVGDKPKGPVMTSPKVSHSSKKKGKKQKGKTKNRANIDE